MVDQQIPVLLLVCGFAVHTAWAQWPLGPDFNNNMNAMMSHLDTMNTNLNTNLDTMNTGLNTNLNTMNTDLNIDLNNMGSSLQIMGNTIRINGQAIVENDTARAAEGIAFAGGRVFISANGGLGYSYSSSDGSYTQYSMDGGSPPHGYMYHTGPFRTSIRTW